MHAYQFMPKLQTYLINLFNKNNRYLDHMLTVDNPNFLTFVKQMYTKELIMNMAKITNFLYIV